MLIETEGVRLFALDAGQGEPELVFVHGNGADHTAWHKQIAFFSPLTRVVAVDQRGFGASAKDPEARYTQEHCAADLIAVLRNAGTRRAILVGWSMGGSVVARVAVEHPELVAGVVLVDHNVEAAKMEPGWTTDTRYATEAIVRGLERDFATGFRAMVDSWFPETGREVDFLKQWLWEAGMRAGQDVVLGIRGRGFQEDRRHWLRELEVPVCIVQGGDSYLGGRRMAEYLGGLIPHAEKHVLGGYGHALILTAADQFNAIVHTFWRKLAAAR